MSSSLVSDDLRLAFGNAAMLWLLLMPAVWAEGEAPPIRLKLEAWGASLQANEVNIPFQDLNFQVGNEGILPALSADGRQLAILFGSHWFNWGSALDIVDVHQQASVQRFYLTWLPDLGRPELAFVEAQIAAANAYLEAGGFKTMAPLFDFYAIEDEHRRSPEGGWTLPDYWSTEREPWRVVFWNREQRLEIFDRTGDRPVFELQPPVLAYQAHLGYVCTSRPLAYRGWYDAEADVLAIGLYWHASPLACDRPPRWLVTRLGERVQ